MTATPEHTRSTPSAQQRSVVVPDKPALEGLEAKWSERWKAEETYTFDRTRPRDEVYSIDTPPPTVSGRIHVGHVYSYTHADIMIRYHRMKGEQVFYPFGFDDNGLPHRDLHREQRRHPRPRIVGRKAFIEACLSLIPPGGGAVRAVLEAPRPLRRLAPASTPPSTTAPGASRQAAFLHLLEREQRLPPGGAHPVVHHLPDRRWPRRTWRTSRASPPLHHHPLRPPPRRTAAWRRDPRSIATTRPELLAALRRRLRPPGRRPLPGRSSGAPPAPPSSASACPSWPTPAPTREGHRAP